MTTVVVFGGGGFHFSIEQVIGQCGGYRR